MKSNEEVLLELGFSKGEDNKHFLVYSIPFEKSITIKRLIKAVELNGSFNLKELQAINRLVEEIVDGELIC